MQRIPVVVSTYEWIFIGSIFRLWNKALLKKYQADECHWSEFPVGFRDRDRNVSQVSGWEIGLWWRCWCDRDHLLTPATNPIHTPLTHTQPPIPTSPYTPYPLPSPLSYTQQSLTPHAPTPTHPSSNTTKCHLSKFTKKTNYRPVGGYLDNQRLWCQGNIKASVMCSRGCRNQPRTGWFRGEVSTDGMRGNNSWN